MAYARAGQRTKAEELLQILEQTDELPRGYTEELMKRLLDGLRNALAQDPPEEERPAG